MLIPGEGAKGPSPNRMSSHNMYPNGMPPAGFAPPPMPPVMGGMYPQMKGGMHP